MLSPIFYLSVILYANSRIFKPASSGEVILSPFIVKFSMLTFLMQFISFKPPMGELGVGTRASL